MAANAATAAVTKAARLSLSRVVEQAFDANGNNPVRLNALWDQVKATAPELAKSKTHFKQKVVAAMIDRQDLIKLRVPDPSTKRLVWQVKLQGSSKATGTTPAPSAPAPAPASAQAQ